MWYEKKRRVKDGSKSFGLSKWMAGIVINRDGDAGRVSRFMGKINEYRKFGMEPVNFEVLISCPCGDVE